VDRVNDASNILVRDLFHKETNPDVFVGLPVTILEGTIKGTI